MLKVHNTLTKKKEEFKPVKKNRAGVYVCGITAYGLCHIGNARGATCFDIIVRYLRYKGFDVTYVRNHTDVDDKIINKANEEGRSCKDVSEQFIEAYIQDMASLNNISPDIEPKATEHIGDMISTIEKLISNGYAYEKDGTVFYSVRKFKDYGKLSGKNIEDLESGARVDINEEKEDPLDFALWKASKPGEPKWPSPWGEGRPGWHIECSSMSSKYLGQPFDIHGGGCDLIFPHHENEIAQAEGAEGKKFVNYWLHNGYLNINAEKMSKSLGNFLTTRDVVKKHGGETVRYFLVSNHYRSPVDYSEKALADASAALDRFYETARRLNPPIKKIKKSVPSSDAEKEIFDILEKSTEAITGFMDDDFNTAGVMGVIFEAIRGINRYLDLNPDENGAFYQWVLCKWETLRNDWSSILGVFGTDPVEYFESKKKGSSSKIDETLINALLSERCVARKTKNFKRADEIRAELDKMNITIKDRPDGTTEWNVK